MELTPEQRKLDQKLWWTTVRPWLAGMTSWPTQHKRVHVIRDATLVGEIVLDPANEPPWPHDTPPPGRAW
jgi:hypothetical protein